VTTREKQELEIKQAEMINTLMNGAYLINRACIETAEHLYNKYYGTGLQDNIQSQ